jgi:hypothetical protein
MNKLSEFERVADLPEIQVLPLRNYEKQGAEVWRNSKYKKSA